VAKAAFDAIVQKDTADSGRSRLFARFESIFQLVWVLGALIPTLIATSLFAGFVFTAVVVIGTSGVFVVGLARAGPAVAAPPPSGWGPAAAPPPPPLPPGES
jgi:hypothetical protein